MIKCDLLSGGSKNFNVGNTLMDAKRQAAG